MPDFWLSFHAHNLILSKNEILPQKFGLVLM
jgi:hypothetical protein